MKKIILPIAIYCSMIDLLHGQIEIDKNRDKVWMFGYGCYINDDLFKSSKLTFGDSLLLNLECGASNYRATNASICDTSGQLIFYTNGVFVADSTHQVMDNCYEALSVGLPPNQWPPYGANTVQGALILPQPGNEQLYHLFTERIGITQQSHYYCQSLYQSLIDMDGNAGMGSITLLNNLLLEDSLEVGQITACRHANGRDWWIMVPSNRSFRYHKFLLDVLGIHYMGYQEIGNFLAPFGMLGQAVFSPDGSKYVKFGGYNIYWSCPLFIYDFDRCTGELSNPYTYQVPNDTAFAMGVAVSPNSRYVYVCSDFVITQFDLQANPIGASMDTIGIYDGFVDPYNGVAGTRFFMAQLAPDGKIYINAPNQTRFLHVIDHPDLNGVACGLRQHGIDMPTFNAYSMPNFPNFRLGPIDGSPCDTLGLNVATRQPALPVQEIAVAVSAYPNPASTSCTIGMGTPLPSEGRLEVHDMAGRLMCAYPLRAHTLGYGLNTCDWASGIYVASVWCRGELWGNVQLSIEH